LPHIEYLIGGITYTGTASYDGERLVHKGESRMRDNRKIVWSKWGKAELLLRDRKLAMHVPITRKLTYNHLQEMVELYGMVYVKPDKGSSGVGVMRVEKHGYAYQYQSGVQKLKFSTLRGMFQSMMKLTDNKPYIVQRGIHVLKYEGRPFDFRVMIQKNPARRWEPTGVVGRLAHPHKAVTNGSQGGTIYPTGKLITPIAGKVKHARLLQRMNHLALLTAAQFSRTYPAMNELGIDFAVDHSLKPWILEVNTYPDPCPFTKLDDKAAIKKIVAYAKAYGRHYCLTCTKAKKAPDSL
jgi:hypothetical protein